MTFEKDLKNLFDNSYMQELAKSDIKEIIDIKERWCIDKQKVKDAIKKKIQEHDNGDCNYDALSDLLKDLFGDEK